MSKQQNPFQRIVKGGSLFSVGMVLNNILQLLSGIIVVRLLSVDEYGDFSLGNATIAMLSILCLMGVPTAMIRQASQKPNTSHDQNHSQNILSSSFVIVFLSSSSAALILAYIANNSQIWNLSENLVLVLTLMAFTVPINCSMNMLSAYFRFQQNTAPKVIFQDLLSTGLRVGLLCLALFTVASLKIVLFLYLASALITLALYAYYYKKNRKIPLKFKLDRIAMVSTLKLSIPIMGVAIVPSLGSWFISAITNYFHDAETVAFFAAPNRLTSLLGIPLVAMGFLYLPIVSALDKKTDIDRINTLYQSVTKWAILTSIPIFVFVLFEAEFVVQFLFGTQYTSSAVVLQIIALGACINTFFGNNYLTLVALGESRSLLLVSLINLAGMIGASFLFIPNYGYIGSALAMVTSVAILNGLMSWILFTKHKVAPFSNSLIITVTVASISIWLLIWLLQQFLSGLILGFIFAPLAFYIIAVMPRLLNLATDDDEQIYSSILNKAGPLAKIFPHIRS